MLHREDPAGLIVITQPAHAWVAGQLARAWGNDHFGAVEPREEVCCGAEQHDIGWLDWEAAPTLNERTGRPHRFLEMPLATHLAIWRVAGQRALVLGRYVALLVSLHGTGLYERRDTSRDSAEDVAAIQIFLAEQRAYQAGLLTSLREEPRNVPAISEAAVARNQQLVRVWDALSLALCHGLHGERSLGEVPTADGTTTLSLAPVSDAPDRVRVTPWPFQAEQVTLVCEGRRLPARYSDQATMQRALAAAPWVTLTFHLEPG